jgi:SAM-dependent methyltransferase
MRRKGRVGHPDGLSADVPTFESPADLPRKIRGRFVEGEDTAAYRARLLREIAAESADCAAAYKIISDQISGISDPYERSHASEHEIRYLTTYSLTPPGPGAIVDVAGSKIYSAPLVALKNWTIRSIPVLAFDYETDRLPFDDESVDGVLICEVLEHFTLDPLHCLIEANRIVKIGGFIILTTPNAASWFSVYRALNYEHPSRWAVYTLNVANRKNHIHAREYIPAEVDLLLAGAGFDNIEIFTRDYAVNAPHQPIEGFGTEKRGEGIFARAYKVGPPRKRSLKPVYLDDLNFVPRPKPP